MIQKFNPFTVNEYPTSTVRVLLFAAARERLQRDAVEIALPPTATVGLLRSRLAAAFPEIAPLLARSAIAVNREFAEDSLTLCESDEIAVIPPVSGG